MYENRKMNPEIKDKWLSALRSGEYKQTDGSLKTPEGYCCLGVLCDIAIKENKIPDWELLTYGVFQTVDGEENFLPIDIQKWAGIVDENPSIITKQGKTVTLSKINDDGKSFKEIALYIERYL